MRVTAKAQGFHGQLREIGEVFDIPDTEEPGDWMTTEEVRKGKKAAPMSHLAKPAPVNSPLDPVAAKQAEILQSQPVASAPFTPPAQVYKARHNGGGNFIVVDENDQQVGETFSKDPLDNTKAKLGATAEAERLNKLGTMAEPKETVAEEEERQEQEDDDEGPDA